MRFKENRIQKAKAKERKKPEIPLQERKFERLDIAKMKLPIQRLTNKKSNKYQTLYTDEKGRRVSKANWYAKFKTPSGVPLTVEEVDRLITVTRLGTMGNDVFETFKNMVKETGDFTTRKMFETTVEYSMLDAFLLPKLQTEKSILKGTTSQMGYLSTLKSDAIEIIESRFKNKDDIKILGVAFDLSFKEGKNVDLAKLGDSVRVRVYAGSSSYRGVEQMGEYIYSISTGKVKKSDISEWWD
jgi:hypothetical protein